ncbi:hypothetical protein Efla_001879 [Eimeria flavescens]
MRNHAPPSPRPRPPTSRIPPVSQFPFQIPTRGALLPLPRRSERSSPRAPLAELALSRPARPRSRFTPSRSSPSPRRHSGKYACRRDQVLAQVPRLGELRKDYTELRRFLWAVEEAYSRLGSRTRTLDIALDHMGFSLQNIVERTMEAAFIIRPRTYDHLVQVLLQRLHYVPRALHSPARLARFRPGSPGSSLGHPHARLDAPYTSAPLVQPPAQASQEPPAPPDNPYNPVPPTPYSQWRAVNYLKQTHPSSIHSSNPQPASAPATLPFHTPPPAPRRLLRAQASRCSRRPLLPRKRIVPPLRPRLLPILRLLQHRRRRTSALLLHLNSPSNPAALAEPCFFCAALGHRARHCPAFRAACQQNPALAQNCPPCSLPTFCPENCPRRLFFARSRGTFLELNYNGRNCFLRNDKPFPSWNHPGLLIGPALTSGTPSYARR